MAFDSPINSHLPTTGIMILGSERDWTHLKAKMAKACSVDKSSRSPLMKQIRLFRIKCGNMVT